jgi:hypothetical protein
VVIEKFEFSQLTKGVNTIACPGCHAERRVSGTDLRKMRDGLRSPRCRDCRDRGLVQPTEDYKVFWLKKIAGLNDEEAAEVLERKRPLPKSVRVLANSIESWIWEMDVAA